MQCTISYILSIYAESRYPDGVHGDPGYVLGGALVPRILDEDVAKCAMLWSEAPYNIVHSV